MRIIFTGASSFTGYWFARELAGRGHDVTATFTGNLESYSGLRRRRIDSLLSICRPIWSTPFGSDRFIETISRQEHWDVLCHHGAFVHNYKSDDFDFIHALTQNTYNLRGTLPRLIEKGLSRIILTGSVFEPNEGVGSQPLVAFSPYGLSKGLTADVFQYWCARYGIRLGKFVIPNPFGPLEEPRFTWYLMNTWVKGEIPTVKTPAYVRDNIHVTLLAKIYADFVQRDASVKCNPSGYPESQGAFAERFAKEMRPRLSLPCELVLERQLEFAEPRVRINVDIPDVTALCWDESKAWDDIAEYYGQEFKIAVRKISG